MLFTAKRKSSIIFKDHVIRLIDSNKPDLDSIRAFHQRFLPEDIIREGKIRDLETLKMILEDCVGEWKLKGQEVAFLVPDSQVVVRKVQVPSDIQDNELKGYIFLDIGTSIHLPFENPVFDIHTIEVTDEGRIVLLYAAPEEIVTGYAELLEKVKVKPVAADLSPFAIFRLYQECGQGGLEDNTLCIELNVQTANLSIFDGGNLVFSRHLRMNVDIGGWKKEKGEDDLEYLVWAGSEEHLWGELRDIISEIERVMSFYRFSLNQGKKQITHILLTGEHPWILKFHERLKEMTELAIYTFPEKMFFTAKGQSIPSSFYTCLGLSLKEVKK
ncbi:MAG TPA: pilus assembly protein PilM [Bacillota bacterium]|nr:pilus assembly protein PilM [Bacillota bacterium]